MTDRETVNEYKRVLGEVLMPEELGSRIIERSERTMADGGASRYLRAVFAVSGIAAVAAGIGAIALFNKKFGD